MRRLARFTLAIWLLIASITGLGILSLMGLGIATIIQSEMKR